jgi:ABC-type ATPase with predicted acetyltransferase domain
VTDVAVFRKPKSVRPEDAHTRARAEDAQRRADATAARVAKLGKTIDDRLDGLTEAFAQAMGGKGRGKPRATR